MEQGSSVNCVQGAGEQCQLCAGSRERGSREQGAVDSGQDSAACPKYGCSTQHIRLQPNTCGCSPQHIRLQPPTPTVAASSFWTRASEGWWQTGARAAGRKVGRAGAAFGTPRAIGRLGRRLSLLPRAASLVDQLAAPGRPGREGSGPGLLHALRRSTSSAQTPHSSCGAAAPPWPPSTALQARPQPG